MRCKSAALLFSLGTCQNFALALRAGKHCFGGCELTIAYVGFNDTPPGLSRKKSECLSELKTTSLYLCIEEFCTASGRESWLNDKNEMCVRLGNQTLLPYEIVREYSPEDIASLRRLHLDEASRGSGALVLDEIVIPDETFFGTAFRTLVR